MKRTMIFITMVLLLSACGNVNNNSEQVTCTIVSSENVSFEYDTNEWAACQNVNDNNDIVIVEHEKDMKEGYTYKVSLNEYGEMMEIEKK